MHRALSEYLARHELPNRPRADGSVLIVFEPGTRVWFLPVRNGGLVMEHELCDLPSDWREQERLLQQAGLVMGAQLPWQMALLALTASDTLVLQAPLAPHCALNEMEDAVAQFTEEAGAWRQQLGLDQGE